MSLAVPGPVLGADVQIFSGSYTGVANVKILNLIDRVVFEAEAQFSNGEAVVTVSGPWIADSYTIEVAYNDSVCRSVRPVFITGTGQQQ